MKSPVLTIIMKAFGNEAKNIFTLIKERYNQENLLIIDKEAKYIFAQENKNNIIFSKK